MILRLAGDLARGALVAFLVATPSLILPTVPSETAQIVAFVAVFGAALTALEYGSSYPCIFEFRDAAPFNRTRFLSLLLTVALLSLIARDMTDPSSLTAFVSSIGHVVGSALDFTWSPIRLTGLMLPLDASSDLVLHVRAAAGITVMVLLISVSLFVSELHRGSWPDRSGNFNVWINLPTFDPTRGGDVVNRLDRDGRINIGLGILLPFLLPVLVGSSDTIFGRISLDQPQAMVWAIAIWGFLPYSLIMRGLALQRVAAMILRRRSEITGQPGELAVA
ncbi:hypothetical protein E2L08_05095 [Palleronia sediminis]|uniref:Uncharacterized protein n=1 Tax=Palleronia sediminis TaxID=2547833 RepID=A0A4R6AE56_9RHOB|nr:hypothetical protein [Palleronia sediminis]TDL81497.1 hypothetical protein E2L08_05095 [Palleronia sediminis]